MSSLILRDNQSCFGQSETKHILLVYRQISFPWPEVFGAWLFPMGIEILHQVAAATLTDEVSEVHW